MAPILQGLVCLFALTSSCHEPSSSEKRAFGLEHFVRDRISANEPQLPDVDAQLLTRINPALMTTTSSLEIRDNNVVAQGTTEQANPGGLLAFQDSGTPTADNVTPTPTQTSNGSPTGKSNHYGLPTHTFTTNLMNLTNLTKQAWFPVVHFAVWVYVIGSAFLLAWLWCIGAIDARLNPRPRNTAVPQRFSRRNSRFSIPHFRFVRQVERQRSDSTTTQWPRPIIGEQEEYDVRDADGAGTGESIRMEVLNLNRMDESLRRLHSERRQSRDSSATASVSRYIERERAFMGLV
ncbi:hypothetical protein NA57DRAFT_73498 [Rhizodiscina lignyota]|uniref:Uncharacterized protein n=1 Tax=Rhizodiscina lignyota TaxID=1504668 RepID=A0A9P4ILD1_9PEZI|nr:hypothetical protein NA57DRAFT_73498 [Rhizodiscina lignyota]